MEKQIIATVLTLLISVSPVFAAGTDKAGVYTPGNLDISRTPSPASGYVTDGILTMTLSGGVSGFPVALRLRAFGDDPYEARLVNGGQKDVLRPRSASFTTMAGYELMYSVNGSGYKPYTRSFGVYESCTVSAYAVRNGESGKVFSFDITLSETDAVKELAEGIVSRKTNPKMSETEKVRALYDFVLDNTAYDGNGAATNSDVFGKGTKGDCGDYAYALKQLLDVSGIESYYVNGSGGTDGHFWLVAKADGKWGNVDPTWGDTVSREGYFFRSDAVFRKDHTASVCVRNAFIGQIPGAAFWAKSDVTEKPVCE
jgi:hypothetical protein